MQGKNWWIPIIVVIVSGLAGVFFMGIRTYQDAPPIPDFVSCDGRTVVSHDSILTGQTVFQKYALMDYGSMFGDGAGRGPDFTADALHQTALSMKDFYEKEKTAAGGKALSPEEIAGIEARVKKEIKDNRYQTVSNSVLLSPGQVHAYQSLLAHFEEFFAGKNLEGMHPAAYISDRQDVKELTDFFFWGAWVCGADRPGKNYSFTHNWPFDESAGNTPSAQITLWTVFGCLGFILGLGFVLYMRGRLDKAIGNGQTDRSQPVLTLDYLANFRPTITQRATYKFFAVAILLFLLQVLAGVLTIHDFVKFTNFFGHDISFELPITVTRSWHLQLSLMWITSCWIGASVFVLPMISKEEPRGQLALINMLFALLVFMVLGSSVGIFLGPRGLLAQWWLLGNQGWEFVELGKAWQWMLFAAIGLWAFILYRGSKESLKNAHPLALPNWLFYSVLCVLVLFISGFVAEPKTNFVIADFWRWCVIHMWVEAFFEVFTTALIAYFMYLMGLVTFNAGSRVVYLSTLLFLGSGIIGISHNFYWNAKPVETLALGSIFSTLQVVPLILLTLEAWKLRNTPQTQLRLSGETGLFAQGDTFLFLLGVNFWNFMGAGVFGFIINLPIINYYEHGTYLTVNHGHAALMGVYGNLALAAMLFCARYLIPQESWNSRLIRCAFWSMNLGLVLMVLLDLFPAGILQFSAVVDHGLWFARSQQFLMSIPFQTFTWMRAVGGGIFVVGGVVPLVWFMLSRLGSLHEASDIIVSEDTVPGKATPDAAA